MSVMLKPAKRIVRLLSGCFILFASIATAKNEQVTLSAFYYPPYMDESVASKGLFCELVKAAFKASDYDASFQFYPLSRSTHYVLSGKVMGQLGTKWNFPAKARENELISVPLFYYRVVGFYLKSQYQQINFSRLTDLQDYRIDVIRGSSDAQLLKNQHNLLVQEVSTGEQVLKRIHAKRADIGFMVELTGLSLIDKLYPNSQAQWVMTDDAIQGIWGQVVFSKKYPRVTQYVEAFRKGVNIIKDNGTYHSLFEKYYGSGKVPDIVTHAEPEQQP